MRRVKVSTIQMQMSKCLEDNLKKAEMMIREACANGANIILLPELFERQYFCQERRYEYYNYAKETLDNDAVKMALKLSGELNVLILVSFYSKHAGFSSKHAGSSKKAGVFEDKKGSYRLPLIQVKQQLPNYPY